MLGEVADDRPIFLESELIGDGQQEGVSLREGTILTQLLNERRRVSRVRAPEGGDAGVKVADLITRGTQTVQAAVTLGQEREDRTRHRHARRPVVAGLDPRLAVGA